MSELPDGIGNLRCANVLYLGCLLREGCERNKILWLGGNDIVYAEKAIGSNSLENFYVN